MEEKDDKMWLLTLYKKARTAAYSACVGAVIALFVGLIAIASKNVESTVKGLWQVCTTILFLINVLVFCFGAIYSTYVFRAYDFRPIKDLIEAEENN